MSNDGLNLDAGLLTRLVEALERLAPAPAPSGPIEIADGYLWAPHEGGLRPCQTSPEWTLVS